MITKMATDLMGTVKRRPLTVGPMAALIGWVTFDMAEGDVALEHIGDNPEVLFVLAGLTLAGMAKDTVDRLVRARYGVDSTADKADLDDFGGERE